jgi:hypothetical protein
MDDFDDFENDDQGYGSDMWGGDVSGGDDLGGFPGGFAPDQKMVATFDQIVSSSEQSDCTINPFVNLDFSNMSEQAIQNAKARAIGKLEVIERFEYYVGLYMVTIFGTKSSQAHNQVEGMLDVADGDRKYVCERIPMIDKFSIKLGKVQYFNPVAYILGWYITDGGSKIHDKRFAELARKRKKGGIFLDDILAEIGKHSKNIKEGTVILPDVLRYGRFWMGLPSSVK